MTAHLKGFRIDKNGNLVPKKKRQSVSARIRERKSNRQKIVSKHHAALHSASRNGAGTKGGERA